MTKYIIKPSNDILVKDIANHFYQNIGGSYQRFINRLLKEKNGEIEFSKFNDVYRASDVDDLTFPFSYKDVFPNVRLRFELYLNVFLDYLNPTNDEVNEMDYEIVDVEKHREPNADMVRVVKMKEEDFFKSEQQRWKTALETVKAMIENNLRIDKITKLFMLECLKYVGFTTQERYLFMKPLDYLHSFKNSADNELKLNSLSVILYCLYDLLSSKEMYLKIKSPRIRQIVEPKEKTKRIKRPRYLLIRFEATNTAPFTSTLVNEFLLRLIEKGVLRCSSLTKAFLLSSDEKRFYKYCLINGKICLKRLVEKKTVRI